MQGADGTAAEQSNDAALEADDRFRTALDAMLEAVTIQTAVRDEQGTVVDFRLDHLNRVALDAVGRGLDEVVGRTVSDAFPQRLGNPVHQACFRVVETGDPESIELHSYTTEVGGADDAGTRETTYYSVEIAPLGDGVIVAARDISDEWAARDELNRAYEQLQAAQSLAHIGLWSVDLQTGEVELSDELLRIMGLPEGTAIPNVEDALAQLIAPEDQQLVRETVRDAPGWEKPFTIEVGARRPTGDTRTLSVFGTATSADPGESVRLWGTAQDITEQRQAEDSLRRASVALERERATVELLQTAFLPELPEIDDIEVCATYRPAGAGSLVGGDWYDAFAIDDRHVGVVVGDVAGHGVFAAALMSQVRNFARALLADGNAADAALATMNRLMVQSSGTDLATALVAVVDRSDGTMTWAAAGHPPLVVHDDRRGAVVHNVRNGPPLGAINQPTFRLHSIQLDPNSVVVLYTDGLVERRDEPIDDSIARLAAAVPQVVGLPPAERCDSLCERVLEGRPPRDDVCVLALTYRPQG